MDLEMLERKQTLLMLSNPFSPLILLAFMQVGIAQVSLDEHGKFDPVGLSRDLGALDDSTVNGL